MASPHDLVRIEDPVTRMHITVSRAVAERAGATLLDRPAVDRFGAPLKPKKRTTKVGDPVAIPEQPAETSIPAEDRKEASDG